MDLTSACSPLVGKFWRNQKQLPFSIWFDKEDGDSEANRGSFNQSLEEIRQIGSQKILERDLPAVKIGGRGDQIWGVGRFLQEAILILQSVLRNGDAHLQLLLLHLLRLHRHHRDVPLLSLPAASDYNNISDKINFQDFFANMGVLKIRQILCLYKAPLRNPTKLCCTFKNPHHKASPW